MRSTHATSVIAKDESIFPAITSAAPDGAREDAREGAGFAFPQHIPHRDLADEEEPDENAPRHDEREEVERLLRLLRPAPKRSRT